MSKNCTTCRFFGKCCKPSKTSLKACNNHREKVPAETFFSREEIENKLETLELAMEEREAIITRKDFTKGQEFIELNNCLIKAYSKTISSINKELFKKYNIFPSDIDKEAFLTLVFKEEASA